VDLFHEWSRYNATFSVKIPLGRHFEIKQYFTIKALKLVYLVTKRRRTQNCFDDFWFYISDTDRNIVPFPQLNRPEKKKEVKIPTYDHKFTFVKQWRYELDGDTYGLWPRLSTVDLVHLVSSASVLIHILPQ